MTLEGKVAIVTGAAGGIGFEICSRLAEAGANLALVDVDAAGVDLTAGRLRGSGGEVIGLTADVSDELQVQAMAGEVLGRWGRVDILVNNAGICPATPVEDISPEEWDLVLGVNLKGAFLCSKAVIPAMRRRRAGKIVNIASSAAQTGGLLVGLHYSSAKAGILGMTRSLARILAPDVQVNAVAPGTTTTRMIDMWSPEVLEEFLSEIPAARFGTPGDVAAAVLFLVSDEASYLTGQTLNVNGGVYMG